jgi:iron complex transport system substrate-binding protein
MLKNEPRYVAFKAYRDRQVWVYDLRLTESGASDYFLRSVSRPDLVLADLVKIFHPALVPDHVFEWYMRVPDRN